MVTTILRICAFCVALVIVVLSMPAFFLGRAFPGEELIPFWKDAATTVGFVLALTAGFFFISLYGGRIIKSVALRFVGGLLLAMPIAISVMSFIGGYVKFASATIPLLLFSILLFSAFIFPAWTRHVKPPSHTDAPRQ